MGQYLPVLALGVLAFVFAILSILVSRLMAPRLSTPAKEAPYECGIVPSREPPERFPVKFFLVAMIFIVFDIEIIFFIPWAVVFRDLGLLVVDEEQRFGVAHKEKIKQLRKKVDVLTMTATPIPRTLNMSLVGIRDMSIIETPPKDRLSIQTNVVKFDQQVIGRAIRTEIARGGQVYLVHNRVESIYSIGSLIQRLVPEARVAIGHGQMSEDELEREFAAEEAYEEQLRKAQHGHSHDGHN